MARRNKVIYWVTTLWLYLGMASSAIVQLSQLPQEVDIFRERVSTGKKIQPY